MLERPQLLEPLGPFERRGFERRQNQQGGTAIRVETDMLKERRPSAAGVPHVGYGSTREIERIAAAVDDHLDDVRIGQICRIDDAATESRHLHRWIGGQRHNRFSDGARVDERLVALNVHDDVAVERRGDLRQPIRAAGMILARQPDLAAEPPHGVGDADIVGRNDDA